MERKKTRMGGMQSKSVLQTERSLVFEGRGSDLQGDGSGSGCMSSGWLFVSVANA